MTASRPRRSSPCRARRRGGGRALGAHRAQPRGPPALLRRRPVRRAVQAVERSPGILPTIAIPIGQPDQDQQVRPDARPRGVRELRGGVDQAERHADPHDDRCRPPSAGRASGPGANTASAASPRPHVPGFRCHNRHVYRELAPPPDLAESVACVWTSVSRGGVILPDGCVDLVWRGDRLDRRRARRPGAIESPVPVGTTVFGVRFRLGVAGAALGVPAVEFADLSVDAETVLGRGVDRPRGRGRDARAARTRCARGCGRIDPLDARGRAGDGPAGDARGGAGHVARRERAPVAAAVPGRRGLRAEDAGPGAALPAVPRARRGSGARTWRGSRSTRATPTRRISRARRGGSPGRTPAELVASGAGPAGERVRSVQARRRAGRVPSGRMIDRAEAYIWTTARVLEQRRFEVLVQGR